MTRNDFDPSKLNIDFTNIEKEEEKKASEDILKNIILEAKSEALQEQNEPPNIPVSTGDILGVEENSIPTLNTNKVDIDLLSTILTDSDVRTDALKKLDEEKKSLKEVQANQPDTSTIFDINIKTVDDLISILQKNQYDFLVIEPNEEFVRISFKKESILKESRNIKYHIYSNLIIEIKKLSNLSIEQINIEQKGKGEYRFKDLNFEIVSKTAPSNFGEIVFLKIKPIDKTVAKKIPQKQSISAGTAFGYLGAILFIALIFGGAFLTFVIFNAKTPQDVSFFANLGINLNDVNSFLLKVTQIVFSVVILVESIAFAISLFKAILTKKEFRRKKTIFTITSVLLLIVIFATGTLWMTLDKSIKTLPNWQEMSYGNIQVYDNNILKSPNFEKQGALITDYKSIIGPIDLKFDLTYLQKDEARRGFEIQTYIWDFGNGEKIETQTPDIIQTFNKKGNYKISLTLEGIDNRKPGEITQKPASGMPVISIPYLVNITENKLSNGGKTVTFDASGLKPLGDIEWYVKDDLTKPVYEGNFFQPSKVYFEEEAIGMRIKNGKNENNYMTRVFIISGEKSKIEGNIQYEASFDNDLNYTFSLDKIENSFGDGFIKSFKWILEDKEIIKEADILNLNESSTIKYTFQNYGKQMVKVIITNSAGKSTELKQEIQIPKRIQLKNQITFYENGGLLENIKYDEKTKEYSLYEIGTPTTLRFDAKLVRSDNPLYQLESVSWDIKNDGSIDGKEKSIEHTFELAGFEEVGVKYKFVHRKNKTDIIEMTNIISIELIEKEANLVLDIHPESEYVPTLVKMDASLSKVNNDNIVKFIYDYGDGIIEERDAKNAGHKYTKEGNYKIKLTVVTETGKEYSISRSLILKGEISEAKIRVSMKEVPVNQEIDFLSSESVGQIIGYHWNFGDGNISNDANPSHAFSTPGTYKVVLTLDYANNNVMSEEIEIKITE